MRPLWLWLVKRYPTEYRDRFEMEIMADYDDGSRDWIDLARSVLRERRTFGLSSSAPLALAVAFAAPIGYLDLRSSEVQGIVTLILLGAGAWGFLWPRRAWQWALTFGASVPIWHGAGMLAGRPAPYPVEPNGWATLIALVPAAIAAFAAAGVRAGLWPTKR